MTVFVGSVAPISSTSVVAKNDKTYRQFFIRSLGELVTRLAPRKELKTPSLPRTPSRLYRAPALSPNRSSSADHAHSPLVAAWRDFGCGRVHSSLPSTRPTQLSPPSEPILLPSELMRLGRFRRTR